MCAAPEKESARAARPAAPSAWVTRRTRWWLRRDAHLNVSGAEGARVNTLKITIQGGHLVQERGERRRRPPGPPGAANVRVSPPGADGISRELRREIERRAPDRLKVILQSTCNRYFLSNFPCMYSFCAIQWRNVDVRH